MRTAVGAVRTLTCPEPKRQLGGRELIGFGRSGAPPRAGGPACAAGRKGRLAPACPAPPNLRALANSWGWSWLLFASLFRLCRVSPLASRAPLPAWDPARATPCPARWTVGSSPHAQAALPSPGPPRSSATLPVLARLVVPDASSPPSPSRPSWRSPTPRRPPSPRCRSPPVPPRTSGPLPRCLRPRFCPGRAPRRGCQPP